MFNSLRLFPFLHVDAVSQVYIVAKEIFAEITWILEKVFNLREIFEVPKYFSHIS